MPITHTSLFISKHGWMKRQRILCICTILCSLAWAPGSAVAAATSTQGAGVGASVLGLDEAVAIAIADNPNLAQMQARYEARSAVPSQVGTLPDPVLSFNALNLPTDTFNTGQEAMTQMQIGISQRFPYPGKLALYEQESSFEAEAALNNVEETRLGLIRDVRSSWWTLHYLDQALTIVTRNQELLRQFVEIVRTKYEVGSGLQQDVLLAQLELSKLLAQKIQLTGLRRAEAAQLKKLINRPMLGQITVPTSTHHELPDLADEKILFARADQSRPRLAEIRNNVRAAESRLGLAKKDYYPDFTVGALYGFRRGENAPHIGGDRADFLSVRLSVNLPIYPTRKRASAVDQRTSEVLVQRYALQNELNAAYAEISKASADYTQAREAFSLFGTGIIPQARQTVQSMLAGYRVDEVDFLNLVRSQITLFSYETQYWRSLSVAHQALARLYAAVGGEITDE